MFCTRCKNDIADCTCPDIDDRLGALTGTVIYRKCRKCGKHYARCQCKDPEWVMSEKADAY
jgi:hypothetical protein